MNMKKRNLQDKENLLLCICFIQNSTFAFVLGWIIVCGTTLQISTSTTHTFD